MAAVTKAGAPYENGNDAVTSNDFAALLHVVRVRIGELVDRLIRGDIDVKPFRIGNESPCADCSYRSVCRFDPTMDRYRHFDHLSRSQALEAATAEGSAEGSA
jgi:ATP-dependent helicase/nuclease subunit B